MDSRLAASRSSTAWLLRLIVVVAEESVRLSASMTPVPVLPPVVRLPLSSFRVTVFPVMSRGPLIPVRRVKSSMTMDCTRLPDKPPRLMVFSEPCVPAEAATSTFPAVLFPAFSRLPFVTRMALPIFVEARSRAPLLTVTLPDPRESASVRVTVPVPESAVDPEKEVLPPVSVTFPVVSITREPAPDMTPAHVPPSPRRAVAPPAIAREPRKVFAPVSSNVPPWTASVLPAVPLITPA